jgi:hypothetical protein
MIEQNTANYSPKSVDLESASTGQEMVDEVQVDSALREEVAASLVATAAANAAFQSKSLPMLDSVDAPEGGFGPTLWSEFIAAGVDTLPFVASKTSVIFSPDIAQGDRDKVIAVIAVHDPTKQMVACPPDCQSLPWWRTALKLWMRTDAAGNQLSRYDDVDLAIKALETATNQNGTANIAVQRQGILAREQFEYSNTVLRADLIKLAAAFNFTPADVDESLWRADRVRHGDLSGNYPLN